MLFLPQKQMFSMLIVFAKLQQKRLFVATMVVRQTRPG
jgi:hypothetical protein